MDANRVWLPVKDCHECKGSLVHGPNGQAHLLTFAFCPAHLWRVPIRPDVEGGELMVAEFTYYWGWLVQCFGCGVYQPVVGRFRGRWISPNEVGWDIQDWLHQGGLLDREFDLYLTHCGVGPYQHLHHHPTLAGPMKTRPPIVSPSPSAPLQSASSSSISGRELGSACIAILVTIYLFSLLSSSPSLTIILPSFSFKPYVLLQQFLLCLCIPTIVLVVFVCLVCRTQASHAIRR